jgi:hypothetical protein
MPLPISFEMNATLRASWSSLVTIRVGPYRRQEQSQTAADVWLEPPAAPSLGAAADHIVALAMAGRVPWAGGTGRIQRTGEAPLTVRGRDSLNQSRAT